MLLTAAAGSPLPVVLVAGAEPPQGPTVRWLIFVGSAPFVLFLACVRTSLAVLSALGEAFVF